MTKKRAPRAQRPRMADIADVAKVSTATVSRVLNGKPGASDDVRQAVLAAMDMLGYGRPVALRAKSEGLVGVIVAEFANPIFAAFAQAKAAGEMVGARLTQAKHHAPKTQRARNIVSRIMRSTSLS